MEEQDENQLRVKMVLHITLVTITIGLAISYLTQLFNVLPKLNFLEAVGLYCLWTPVHNLLIKSRNE
jgi:hypothetical protein